MQSDCISYQLYLEDLNHGRGIRRLYNRHAQTSEVVPRQNRMIETRTAPRSKRQRSARRVC